MEDRSVLLCGAGSIGRRHGANLRALGMRKIAVFDTDTERLREAGKSLAADTHNDMREALASCKPDIAFVCSPTQAHMPQATELAEAGIHLFIEKPLSHTLDGIDTLRKAVTKRNLVCMVGCNMRFHHGPATVKRIVDAGTIGAIKRATVYTGSYLPDWRPQSDYKTSYSANPGQGGVILDCIHEIDLALWYLGPATLERCSKQTADAIGIPVEGTADLTLRHEHGAVSEVHLSFTEREYRRFCRLEGTRGTVAWDIADNRVTVTDTTGAVTETIDAPAEYELNRMYVEEIVYFLTCCEQKRVPLGNLEEATAVLRIALEAKKR